MRSQKNMPLAAYLALVGARQLEGELLALRRRLLSYLLRHGGIRTQLLARGHELRFACCQAVGSLAQPETQCS